MVIDRLGSKFGMTQRKLDELRSEVAVLRMRLAIKRFDEALHPRWPGGTPDSRGGEFRPKTSDDERQVQRVASFDEANRVKCDAMHIKDAELCGMQLSKWCWDSAYERYNNCMRGMYIPDLKVGMQWGR